MEETTNNYFVMETKMLKIKILLYCFLSFTFADHLGSIRIKVNRNEEGIKEIKTESLLGEFSLKNSDEQPDGIVVGQKISTEIGDQILYQTDTPVFMRITYRGKPSIIERSNECFNEKGYHIIFSVSEEIFKYNIVNIELFNREPKIYKAKLISPKKEEILEEKNYNLKYAISELYIERVTTADGKKIDFKMLVDENLREINLLRVNVLKNKPTNIIFHAINGIKIKSVIKIYKKRPPLRIKLLSSYDFESYQNKQKVKLGFNQEYITQKIIVNGNQHDFFRKKLDQLECLVHKGQNSIEITYYEDEDYSSLLKEKSYFLIEDRLEKLLNKISQIENKLLERVEEINQKVFDMEDRVSKIDHVTTDLSQQIGEIKQLAVKIKHSNAVPKFISKPSVIRENKTVKDVLLFRAEGQGIIEVEKLTFHKLENDNQIPVSLDFNVEFFPETEIYLSGNALKAGIYLSGNAPEAGKYSFTIHFRDIQRRKDILKGVLNVNDSPIWKKELLKKYLEPYSPDFTEEGVLVLKFTKQEFERRNFRLNLDTVSDLGNLKLQSSFEIDPEGEFFTIKDDVLIISDSFKRKNKTAYPQSLRLQESNMVATLAIMSIIVDDNAVSSVKQYAWNFDKVKSSFAKYKPFIAGNRVTLNIFRQELKENGFSCDLDSISNPSRIKKTYTIQPKYGFFTIKENKLLISSLTSSSRDVIEQIIYIQSPQGKIPLTVVVQLKDLEESQEPIIEILENALWKKSGKGYRKDKFFVVPLPNENTFIQTHEVTVGQYKEFVQDLKYGSYIKNSVEELWNDDIEALCRTWFYFDKTREAKAVIRSKEKMVELIIKKQTRFWQKSKNRFLPKKFRRGPSEDDYPIVGVSIIESYAYCLWLKKKYFSNSDIKVIIPNLENFKQAYKKGSKVFHESLQKPQQASNIVDINSNVQEWSWQGGKVYTVGNHFAAQKPEQDLVISTPRFNRDEYIGFRVAITLESGN